MRQVILYFGNYSQNVLKILIENLTFDDKVQKTLSLKDKVIKLHVILVKWLLTMQKMQLSFQNKLHQFLFYFIIYHTHADFPFPLQFNRFIKTE